MIKIIDYGLGNLSAFTNAFKSLNKTVEYIKTESDFKNASHIILPGVGSFDFAMELLSRSNLIPSLNDAVLSKKIPILGICVGMQIMAKKSEEGVLDGLSWIDAEVKNMNHLNDTIYLPHMGWNNIEFLKDNPLNKNLNSNPNFYFLHSYYLNCTDHEAILATSFYGKDFTCSVNNENIFGVQFHPEKSHSSGLQLLKNFSEL